MVYVVGKDNIPEVFTLNEGGSLEMTIVVLPGVSCDIPLRVELNGEGAEARINGLYLCNSSERVRISVDLLHNAPGCTSRQLFKGVVGGSASTEFYGRIYVRKDSQRTKAYQENHNILISDTAHAETKPQLEIYADDVECSHGATIGALSEDEQYYMRSRGIPEDEAKVLQMISFISEVVETIADEDLKQQIYDSLSECQA